MVKGSFSQKSPLPPPPGLLLPLPLRTSKYADFREKHLIPTAYSPSAICFFFSTAPMYICYNFRYYNIALKIINPKN